jgi:hypothetical protein
LVGEIVAIVIVLLPFVADTAISDEFAGGEDEQAPKYGKGSGTI